MEPAAPDVEIRKRRGISPVWLIPVVAGAIALWLGYKTITEKGPTITIAFETAEGLEAEKTKLKIKDIDVGLVQEIRIKEDLSGVVVTAELDKGTESFLTDQTRFWVVRPRADISGISGLGTLVSGSYIEIDPSIKGEPARSFTGLEVPPLVRTDRPGNRYVLVADKLGSFSRGSPIYYRGFKAGQVLGYELTEDEQGVFVHIFIDEAYTGLVKTSSRFWNVSGVQVEAGSEGMRIKMESLAALIEGGIAFDTPRTLETADLAEAGTGFSLYASLEASEEASYVRRYRYILYFDGSVRGLSIGAPVEIRGVKVGKVIDLKMEFDRPNLRFRIPVLIEIEPDRVVVIGEQVPLPQVAETSAMSDDIRARAVMRGLVARGLRGQLESGSLITGQLFVSLDFHPDTEAQFVDTEGRYGEIPTIPSTIEALTASVTGVLDKIARLQLEELVADMRETVQTAQGLVASPELKQSVANLNESLVSLRSTLDNVDQQVGPLVSSLRETSDTANRTLKQARVTLASTNSLIGEGSQIRYDLSEMLRELAEAARSIRVLADYLEQNPEAFVRGKGGPD
ncbi:MAG: MlaD family protein [Alphaproteobacteria bacterium]|nr:MlaD family protein [Alphaproteobacteria bacterium]